jgi:hypothetical protein
MGLKENTMSYYSDLAFVVAFDDKEKLTAWLCASMLEIQQNMEWYADDRNSQGFTDQLGLIDVFKAGAYREYHGSRSLSMLKHAFAVESSFNRLPWAIEKQLRELSDTANNMGGGGGYIILGEDHEDTNMYSTANNDFCISDYFEMQRVIRQTNETYAYDGGKLLADILGVK